MRKTEREGERDSSQVDDVSMIYTNLHLEYFRNWLPLFVFFNIDDGVHLFIIRRRLFDDEVLVAPTVGRLMFLKEVLHRVDEFSEDLVHLLPCWVLQ